MSWAVDNWPVIGGFAAGLIAWGKTMTDVSKNKEAIAEHKTDIKSANDHIAEIKSDISSINTHLVYTRAGIDDIKKWINEQQ